MEKYFEYKDEKSAKFWKITVSGDSHTVNYGKIGTDGQQKTKEFSSSEEALESAEKLIVSKLKKGYSEINQKSSTSDSFDASEWLKELAQKTNDNMALLKDQHSEVEKYLKSVFPDSDDKVVDLLMKQLDSIAMKENGTLLMNFKNADDGEIVTVNFKQPKDEDNDSPCASLQELYKMHSNIQIECYGGGWLNCPSGGAESGWFEEYFEGDFKSYPAVFEVGQNLMVADLNNKNTYGEPTLFFVGHDEIELYEIENSENLTARQVFLMLILQHLDVESYFDDVYF